MTDWFLTYSGIFLPYHTRMTDELFLTYCNEKQFSKNKLIFEGDSL